MWKLISTLAPKFFSRKWLVATGGNILLALFARWLVPALAAIQPALAWLGLGVTAALAVGLWVYVLVEGKLDLERLRREDPVTRARQALQVYQEAIQGGVEPEHALDIIRACLDQDALGFLAQIRQGG